MNPTAAGNFQLCAGHPRGATHSYLLRKRHFPPCALWQCAGCTQPLKNGRLTTARSGAIVTRKALKFNAASLGCNLATVLLARQLEQIYDAAVVIEDTTIYFAGRRDTMLLPPNARVLDFADSILAPGLIDIHMPFIFSEPASARERPASRLFQHPARGEMTL
jgi:hypothetical protein